MRPIRLEPEFIPKLWGSPHLEPWFPDADSKIGEVWFSTPEIPLLVKFLFTTENLSVQVHPDDDYARQHEQSRGKTEMWHILRAEAGAKIAVGFERSLDEAELEQAAKSNVIMELLRWIAVRPGETYFIPAGVVHAIGGGLALCEIQQYSDVTYRIYDYGRDRELHLKHGLKVAQRGCHPGVSEPKRIAPHRDLLVDCDHFRTERIEVHGEWADDLDQPHLLIALEGSGSLGGEEFATGQAWKAPGKTEVRSANARLLRTAVPI